MQSADVMTVAVATGRPMGQLLVHRLQSTHAAADRSSRTGLNRATRPFAAPSGQA